MFVTIDGPNGVGKTSVVSELTERLRRRGSSVTSVREPSGSDVGRFARQNESHLVGRPLAALVIADRYLQIETEIKPVLESGATVVSDRYVASTLVLQRLDGLSPELLWEMSRDVLIPDLTVVLTATVTTLSQRLSRRSRLSRFEQMPGIAEREVAYYKAAVHTMRDAGFRVVVLDTEGCEVSRVVDRVIEEMDRT